jgi:hypothetical protein
MVPDPRFAHILAHFWVALFAIALDRHQSGPQKTARILPRQINSKTDTTIGALFSLGDRVAHFFSSSFAHLRRTNLGY